MDGRVIETVREAWTALPEDVPYLVGLVGLLMIRDGAVVVEADTGSDPVPAGDTGYAILEARPSRDVRVRSLHPSPLRENEVAMFRAYVEERIAALKNEIDDAQRDDVESVARELIAMIKLANRLAGHRQRRPAN